MSTTLGHSKRTTALLVVATGLAVPAAAHAKVTRTHSAVSTARAIVAHQTQLRGARWIKHPPHGSWAAVSSTRLVGFPRAGSTFGVLSSGAAGLIARSNSSDALSTDNGGASWRGTRDTVVLRVDLRAPANARCLSFTFRFLSEEYPEYVDSDYNDAFIAELDRSTWTAATGGPTIRAGRNFARVRDNRLVSVNGAGDFAVTADRARGTTYDAGTRRLRASTPITPGKHSIYFSIFDQGDRQFDSSVVLDKLTADDRKPCVSGSSLD